MAQKRFRGYCAAGCGSQVFSKHAKTKFCSLKCSNARFKKSFPRIPCITCDTPVSRARQKYCSLRCQQNAQFKLRILAFEGGSYQPRYGHNFIRRYLIFKLGEKCARCDWNERHPKTGRVPIEVEHIDGNWQNNRPDNLTLLCPNCHALTDTFRGLNRGRGRAARLGGRDNPFPSKRRSTLERSAVARLPIHESKGP